jgi:hypothetical protein
MVWPETRDPDKGPHVIISGRYNGPPASGNGGYSAGLVSSYVDGPAVVTLRLPPPLDVPLRVERDGAEVQVYDGERLIATASPASEGAPPPEPVPLAEAVDAAARYPGLVDHPYPTCFVCGPARTDGLGVFPGPVGESRTAAPWTVPADVHEAMVWAALDCPGGWAIISPGRPYVLGRMAAVVAKLPVPGDTCVVTGLCTEVQGRKAFVTSAAYASDGTLVGHATATWIAV